ncbi:hypothetical protein AWB97_25315 [Mycobacterium intracellulare subsp. chimaera]|nr:hypothetical protein AWB97_25315 [Mycobacterium intracellulare subsp. chimaera]
MQLGGVFGVHPAAMRLGESLLVGALFDEPLVQLGEFCSGRAFSGSTAAGQDGVDELAGVVVGGVAAGP